ncbi:chaperonin 10-like protein [Phascolomyces articulosus]|uniref:Chaperonin 10-like protein n=1 Tax=Phascolomyces articulosus TaxID=60185 RepID=A0AAD5JXB9_9FUNG|nr:chaperonin 10-like protein [Phascolomyces articulosus]
MSIENTFHGWACPGKGQPLEWRELPLKKFEDDDLEISVTHCGICGSDIHTMDSGWGPTDYPCVTGHEIVGVVTKLGKNVMSFSIGDRVGIGAQCGSCDDCKRCNNDQENVCCQHLTTYNSRWKCGDKTFGGHSKFVFKIPDALSSEAATVFFCGGVTTYWPLKNHGVNENSHVGIIGVGGLGHFAIQWAKALGAYVTVFSRSDREREDAKLLGADDYVISTDEAALRARDGTFSHIMCTSFGDNFAWLLFLGLMEPNGTFIVIDYPEAPLTNIPAGPLIYRQISIVGTALGSPKTTREMLDFAAEKGVKP